MNFEERFQVTKEEKEFGAFMAKMNLLGPIARRLADRKQNGFEADGLPSNIILENPMDSLMKKKENGGK